MSYILVPTIGCYSTIYHYRGCVVLAVSDKRILPRDLGILVRVSNGNTRRGKAIQRVLLNTIRKGIYLQEHGRELLNPRCKCTLDTNRLTLRGFTNKWEPF